MSTTGLDDDGASEWLDDFFRNCDAVDGCEPSRIKYIAFHDYSGDVSQIIRRAEGLQRRYARQVWITEFAIQKWATPGLQNVTRDIQDKYMKEVLPALDASDAVFRYVWYSARNKPVVNVANGNLLEWNVGTPTLTSTGVIYKAHADGK